MDTALPNDAVVLSFDGAIATITLNRPKALNAIEEQMVEALAVATRRVAEAEDIRAVVIAGTGDHFMAGGDLRTFKGWVDEADDPDALGARFETFINKVHPSIENIRTMPKPVLASVQGACAGFGLSLMLACDLAIATEDAYFTLAYSAIGTSPDGSSTWSLPRAVGMKKAFEIALLGDRFDPEEARRLGLINRIVSADDLSEVTAKMAARLAAGPTHAFANTKALLNASWERALTDQMAAEAAAFGDCARGPDFAEGLAAFLEKRRPTYKGR